MLWLALGPWIKSCALVQPLDSGSVDVKESLALRVVENSPNNSKVESDCMSENLWFLLLKISVLECFHLQP